MGFLVRVISARHALRFDEGYEYVPIVSWLLCWNGS